MLKKTPFLQGYRTFIGFVVGTLLVLYAMYKTVDPTQLVNIIAFGWTPIYLLFIGKNHLNKVQNDKTDIESTPSTTITNVTNTTITDKS